jgi:hypothetical protein
MVYRNDEMQVYGVLVLRETWTTEICGYRNESKILLLA